MAVSKVFKTFRGDVIFFSLLNMGSNDENCIEVQIFGFSKSSRSFTRTAKQLLPLGILGHELELVSAKCLMNSTTRMYQPGLSITYLTFFHGSCICMLSQSFPLFSQTCHWRIYLNVCFPSASISFAILQVGIVSVGAGRPPAVAWLPIRDI